MDANHEQDEAMKRWLPYPMLSAALGLLWLTLNNTVAAGHLVLALAMGLVVPWLAGPVLSQGAQAHRRPPGRRLRLGLRLAVTVLGDILVSNLAVARLILSAREGSLAPTLVTIDLRLTTPGAIAALAGIVTLTPGTLSADIIEADAGGVHRLLVHALDAPDPDALVAEIRSRYEEPLLEMLR